MNTIELNRGELHVIAMALSDVVNGTHSYSEYKMSDEQIHKVSGFSRDMFARLTDKAFAVHEMLYGKHAYEEDLPIIIGYEESEVKELLEKINQALDNYGAKQGN